MHARCKFRLKILQGVTFWSEKVRQCVGIICGMELLKLFCHLVLRKAATIAFTRNRCWMIVNVDLYVVANVW